MNIIDQFLTEALHPTLYHVSHIQDLKQIKASTGTSHDGKQANLIYACSDKTYVSAFGWPWNDSMASLGRINNGPWILKVSKKYKPQMQKPCSLYTVSGDTFKPIKVNHQEFTSTQSTIPTLSEIKYKSALEWVENNLGIKEFT